MIYQFVRIEMNEWIRIFKTEYLKETRDRPLAQKFGEVLAVGWVLGNSYVNRRNPAKHYQSYNNKKVMDCVPSKLEADKRCALSN